MSCGARAAAPLSGSRSPAGARSPPPPSFLSGLGALAHRLLTFKRWGDEHRYVMRFLVCFLIMIAELLFENCMVW